MKYFFMFMFCIVAIPFAYAQELFRPIINTPSLNTQEQKLYNLLLNDNTTVKTTFITIDTSVFNNDHFTISLFGKELQVYKVKVVKRADNEFSLFARFNDDNNGHVIFTVRKGDILANIFFKTQYYEIKTVGKGKYVLREYEQRKYAGESCMMYNPRAAVNNTEPFPAKEPRNLNNTSSYSRVTGNGINTLGDIQCHLRVLIVYTDAVAASVSDPINLAQQCIDLLNQTYSNSMINFTADLAYAGEISYVSGGNLIQDDDRFMTSGDGYMDDIFTLRDDYTADICVLLSTSTGCGGCTDQNGNPISICGHSEEIYADKDHAFCAVCYSCAVNSITVPHEIGHLLGGRHNIDPVNTPFANGHGHDEASAGYSGALWRTVMAVKSSSTRIPYFTNPSVLYGGIPTGPNPTNYDMAAVQNHTITDAIAFRQLQPSITISSISIGAPAYADIVSLGTITTSGTVHVNATSNVTMRAGNSISLAPGFSSAATFLAEIVKVPKPCGGDPNAGGTKNGGETGGDDNEDIFASGSLNNVNIYPNPVQNVLNIGLVLRQDAKVSFVVSNLIGQQIGEETSLDFKTGQQIETLSTAGLIPGVYFITVKTANGHSQFKFIKQ